MFFGFQLTLGLMMAFYGFSVSSSWLITIIISESG